MAFTGIDSLQTEFARETAQLMVGQTFDIGGKTFTLNHPDRDEDARFAAYLIGVEAKMNKVGEQEACNRIQAKLNQPNTQQHPGR